jgi:bifunctional DNA-binding transcriptional regulator/antitoxin component of YhaV-PrlF toxin-antitoxin module
MPDSEAPQKERTLTLPSEWPPPHITHPQPSPVKRKSGTYTSISLYIPAELRDKLNFKQTDTIGIWPGKRNGRDDTFLAVKLTQEEVAKLPNNSKRKRHNCDHESSPRGALYCITCGASLRGKTQ